MLARAGNDSNNNISSERFSHIQRDLNKDGGVVWIMFDSTLNSIYPIKHMLRQLLNSFYPLCVCPCLSNRDLL